MDQNDPREEAVTAAPNQKTPPSETLSHNSSPDHEKLPGILRMEAFADEITFSECCILLSSVFLVGYAFSLDLLVRSTYQSYATSSYAQHSLLSTVNVIRGVVVAVVQPLVAKLSDLLGRLELFLVVTLFYVVGTVVETCATNVQIFAAGALLY